MSEIRYTLIAEVDGVEVFNADYPDTVMLEEDGLRKAEYQVEAYLEENNICALCGEEMTANCNNGGCS